MLLTVPSVLLHISFAFIIYILVLYNLVNKLERISIDEKTSTFYQLSSSTRDPNSKIIALVLFTYKKSDLHAQLVSKYLIANLKSNGGVLDQIIFGIQTNRLQTIQILKETYPTEITLVNTNHLIASKYSLIQDNDYVFKVNENIVFISNNSFQTMLDEYLENDHEYLSANFITDSMMFNIHANLGAIKPFATTFFNNWMIYDHTNSETIENCQKEWRAVHKCSSLAHENFFYNLKLNNLKVYNFGRWSFTNHSNNFLLFKGYQLKQDLKNLEKRALAIGNAIVSYVNDFEKEKQFIRCYKNLAKKYLSQ